MPDEEKDAPEPLGEDDDDEEKVGDPGKYSGAGETAFTTHDKQSGQAVPGITPGLEPGKSEDRDRADHQPS